MQKKGADHLRKKVVGDHFIANIQSPSMRVFIDESRIDITPWMNRYIIKNIHILRIYIYGSPSRIKDE